MSSDIEVSKKRFIGRIIKYNIFKLNRFSSKVKSSQTKYHLTQLVSHFIQKKERR
jgi:hypothetical protein